VVSSFASCYLKTDLAHKEINIDFLNVVFFVLLFSAIWDIHFFWSEFSKNHKLQTINSSMQELIDKLKAEAGLTDEQAKKAIETIKNFVVEKFPMLESAVGSLFGQS
jgi:hypothetical protein